MTTNSTLQRICSSNIHRLRTQAGYTQVQMAELLGVTQSAFSLMEKAKCAVNVPTLERIATIFKCDPSDLLQPMGKFESVA